MITLDGTPQPFLRLGTPTGRWVAIRRHGDLTITIAASPHRRIAASQCRVLADQQGRWAWNDNKESAQASERPRGGHGDDVPARDHEYHLAEPEKQR
jgi:hypothetical protein